MSGLVKGMGQMVNYAFNSLDMTSSANDIIAVRHRDGTLHSSPFTVRFGKVKVLRPQDKVVTIEVNGEMTTAVMKIGSDGAAYWLQPVSGEAAGSDIVSPLDSPLRSPLASPTSPASSGDPQEPAPPLESPGSSPARAAKTEAQLPSTPPAAPILADEDPEVLAKDADIAQLLESLAAEKRAAEDTPCPTPLTQPLSEPEDDDGGLRLSRFASVNDLCVAELPLDELAGEEIATGAGGAPPAGHFPPVELSPSEVSSEYSDGSSEDDAFANSLDQCGRQLYRGTLIPSHHDLEKLNLKEGLNTVKFCTGTTLRGKVEVQARVYLWPYNAKLVISDVDGTVTKSDVMGHIATFFGKDWTHPGLCALYSKIAKNGYRFVYLTARSVSQVEATRSFLFSVEQEGLRLPDGPVLTAPDKLFTALTQELSKKSHEFKISCLSSVRDAFPQHSRPFYAGFGNRIGDVVAYTASEIRQHKIFIINKDSVVHVCHVKQNYKNLSDLVDQTFPALPDPQQRKEKEHLEIDVEFNSFNYWRVPPDQLLDTPPPKETPDPAPKPSTGAPGGGLNLPPSPKPTPVGGWSAWWRGRGASSAPVSAHGSPTATLQDGPVV